MFPDGHSGATGAGVAETLKFGTRMVKQGGTLESIIKGRVVPALQKLGIASAALSRARRPKILCYINHYFGSASKFVGRSTSGVRQTREDVVRAVISRIQSLPFEVDIRICGFPQEALVPVDVDLSAIGEPRWIVYESIERMFGSVGDYDFFLNIEDDILVNDDLIANVLAFHAASEVNEVYLPNRMERRANGEMVCVDQEAMPGWTGLSREFQGATLDVAVNPHSGLFLLTRQQMRYAANRIFLDRREQFHGGYMASAYANVHAPFLVWRAKSDPMAHHVIHADRWMHSVEEVHAARHFLQDGSGQELTVSVAEGATPLGYVDSLNIDGVFCQVNGWAIDTTGEPLPLDSIHLGSHAVTDIVTRRYDRPDVAEVHSHAQACAGFEMCFPLIGLPQQALASDKITVRGKTLNQEYFELPLGPHAIWPSLRAREVVAQSPLIADVPWMPKLAANRLRKLLETATCYLEYGSGGTTVMAASMNVPEVVTTESDRNWLAAVRHKLHLVGSSTCAELIHVDVGPTGGLGYPDSETNWKQYFNYPFGAWRHCSSRGLTPNVVLIDGRFRVACFLASLLHAAPGTVIIFDDYFDRPYYHVAERFTHPPEMHDRSAEFVTSSAPPVQDICFELLRFIGDPR